MEKVRFGKTELRVSKIAFGAIPVQRLSHDGAVEVIRGAVDLGVNFIDTANGYSDSEEKIGAAIKNMQRQELIIASKSGARDKKTFLEHIDLSLKRLGTDYIDIYQLHNNMPPGEGYNTVFGENGAYEALTEAIRAGKVRFAGFTSHSLSNALNIMRDKKYNFASVQLPFNFIDDEAAKEAIPLAKELDIGFIAMKPFGGGLLDDAKLALKYLFQPQFEGIVPDPGIEKLSEIREIAGIINSGEKLTESDREAIGKIKAAMSGKWCHRCDYCQPCPEKIPAISMILNTESFFRRMPYHKTYEIASGAIESARKNCTGCGTCSSRCPYDLDIPALLKEKIAAWDKYVAENS
jgi:predicted aldo/keto reductase-like oxidoreductase